MVKNLKVLVFLILCFLISPSLVLSQEQQLREKIRKDVEKYIDETIKKELKKNLKEDESKKTKKHREEKKHKKSTVSAVFQNLEVPENIVVEGDVSAVFASGVIKGKIKGDLQVVFSSVRLDKTAEVEGDVTGVFSTLDIHPDAIIKGDKEFVFSSQARISPARLRPSKDYFHYLNPAIKNLENIKDSASFSKLKSKRFKTLTSFGYLIIALLVYLFIPRHLEAMNEAIGNNMSKTFLTGFISLLLIIPVGILLIISIIGLLVLPLYIPLVLLAIVVGKVAVAYFIGDKLSKALSLNSSPVLFLIFGMALVQITLFVPILGALAGLFFITMGLGSTVATRFGTKRV